MRSLGESEDVEHIVEAWCLLGEPGGGAEGAVSEGMAVGGFVSELDSFSVSGEDDGVVSDDVAAAQGVDTDFGGGAFADEALAAVAEGGMRVKVAGGGEDLGEFCGGSAGGVFFEAVVHFDNFDVEVRAEGLSGDAGEGKEEINADAEVWGEDDRDGAGSGVDGFDGVLVLASGAKDESFLGLGAEGSKVGGSGGVGKVNDAVGGGEVGFDGIAEVNGGDEFEVWVSWEAFEESPAHATFGAIDDNFGLLHRMKKGWF